MGRPFTVVAIVSAFNEEDVIGEAVAALIDEGVQVYAIDNHSTDGTRRELERFLGRGVLHIESYPEAGASDAAGHVFAWRSILEHKETLAARIDADWFIHHDADEFRESPWRGMRMVDAIRRVDTAGYNAIDFHVVDFKPTTADDSNVTSVRERLRFYEVGSPWDRLQVKCWKKAEGRVNLTASGGHDVAFDGRRVFPVRFILRHYPIRSQAHGERKVFRERLPIYDPAERAMDWHVQYNDVKPGTSFLRDPATLRRYDADEIRVELVTLNRDAERLERELQSARDVQQQVQIVMTSLRGEHDAAQTVIASLRGEHDAAQTVIASLRGEHDAAQTVIASLRSERDALQTATASLRTERDAIEVAKAADQSRMQAEIDRLRQESVRLQRLVDDIAADRDALIGERASLIGQVSHLEQASAAVSERIRALESEAQQINAALLQARARISETETTIHKLMTSRSWKLTAPLRAVDDWIRQR